ncbi:TerB family tellurite resistance protein [Mucilaginibacter sp. BT774]|uniref:TerB family tellurite resistance protein n=1 Tax=Mucilaginibacter sp. BT774 TaxID=3062276 RepID=UPI00267566EF|nr:TerB family tellurite resistance protein [Mucilaginibacter sp. BT774]MDO3627550.1 TerB family tellurite resistance protein [Mucilaginibacter sp. BT774]
MQVVKTISRPAVLLLVMLCFAMRANAQSDELQQLLLNIEKLTQFKAILSDMKKGYLIYQQGYGTISNLSKGNFDLHHVYLAGLMAVNPVVLNNPRVGQIMSQQSDIISEYKRYASLFRQSGSFSLAELSYMDNVYNQLVKQSNANVDDLANATTAGKLRMSDDDRLRAVDRIYNSSSDQLQFLRYFNRQAVMLSLQRSKDLNDTKTLKRLYGISQ